MYHDPDDYAPVATPAEAVSEWAWNAGQDYTDRAWLLHDYDVWVKNPHYQGAPVPHPDDDEDDRDDEAEFAQALVMAEREEWEAERKAWLEANEDTMPF